MCRARWEGKPRYLEQRVQRHWSNRVRQLFLKHLASVKDIILIFPPLPWTFHFYLSYWFYSSQLSKRLFLNLGHALSSAHSTLVQAHPLSMAFLGLHIFIVNLQIHISSVCHASEIQTCPSHELLFFSPFSFTGISSLIPVQSGIIHPPYLLLCLVLPVNDITHLLQSETWESYPYSPHPTHQQVLWVSSVL